MPGDPNLSAGPQAAAANIRAAEFMPGLRQALKPNEYDQWVNYFLSRGFSGDEARANADHIIRRNGSPPPDLTLEQSGGPGPGPRSLSEAPYKPAEESLGGYLGAIGRLGTSAAGQAAGDSVARDAAAARRAKEDEERQWREIALMEAVKPSKPVTVQATRVPQVAGPALAPTPEGQDAGRDELEKLAELSSRGSFRDAGAAEKLARERAWQDRHAYNYGMAPDGKFYSGDEDKRPMVNNRGKEGAKTLSRLESKLDSLAKEIEKRKKKD